MGIKKAIMQKTGDIFLPMLISVLCKTLRFEFINRKVIKNFEDENQNYILAFWHGSMLGAWYAGKGRKNCALISKSKDGQILASILKLWNYQILRGSSNDGGKEALTELQKLAADKKNIFITPDGPKGPLQKMKAGAVVVAKKTGTPIVFAGVGYQRFKQLKSWDKFIIPFPFSKVKIIYSDSMIIDQNLSYEETSMKIIECEKRLNEIQEQAFQID